MNPQTAHLKLHLAAARQALFHSEGAVKAPLETLHAYSRVVDEALKDSYLRLMDQGGRNPDYCLVALGGYGRKELWPYSDIDILMLRGHPHEDEKLSSAIKELWGLGLALGVVVRTVEECRSILGEDIATDTALLEARYLCGNRHLFESLQKKGIRPYFEKNKKKYIDEISSTLREGLFSSENSLYRIEPDLKNGICTLRDCQRLFWAARVRHGATGFGRLQASAGFSPGEIRKLEAGYAMLAALRSALHMAAAQRLDVLEIPFHQTLADRFFPEKKDAGHLLEVFFKTVREIRLLLLSFLEKDLSGKSIWRDVRRRMGSVEIVPGIALLDGILFPQSRKKIHLAQPESILRIFEKALVCQGTLSVELLNIIRRRLEPMTPDDFRSKAASGIFLSILNRRGDIGQVMISMHETGLLSKIIPSFSGLTCKVEYDPYHEFTVDQHTLLALCACDDLGRDSDEKIQIIYKDLDSKTILRLAVLLHDVGKAIPGDHVQNGAVIAEAMGERLGLSDDQILQVRFLVNHHLDLSNLSLLRDFDDHDLRPFATEIGRIGMLNLLYLLTIVDIRSVGHNTWTGWKAYQLNQLYDRLASHMGQREMKNEKTLSKSDFPRMDPCAEWLTDDIAGDDPHHGGPVPDDIGFSQDLFAGFERLTIRAVDRVGFLSDIIGCLTSEGYNILSAKIISKADGNVLDIFHLEAPDKPRLSPQKRLENIHRKWRLITDGHFDADSLVQDRLKKYPLPLVRIKKKVSAVDVRINNTDAAAATIIEIDTVDNFGLLHQIARCLYENNINIVAAKLSTRNDQACDVFYVTDAQGKKITNDRRIEILTGRLQQCLVREGFPGH